MSKVVAELVVEGQQVFVRELDDAEDAVEGVGEGAEKSERKLSGMVSAMTALGGVLATRELVRWGRDAADYAIELGAMQRKADTVFDEHVGDIRDFSAEHASRFGMAEDALTGLAAGYGDLLIPMGFARDEAATMTERTLELAGALGEWSPQLGGAQHALEALGAAMTGEREQLKAYGIVIDEAAVKTELAARGLDNLTGEAERQAKAQVTLDLALRGSTDAQAQFAAGGDPAVVAANESKAAYEQLRAEVGENLVPVMTGLYGIVGDVLGVFSGLPEPVQTAGIALIGLGTAAVPVASVARAVGDLGISAGGVGRLIGGPWTLAIGAGALALNKWAGEAEEAHRLGETFYGMLRDNADLPNTDRLSRADLTRELIDSEIASRSLRDEMTSLGLTTADVMAAIQGDALNMSYGLGQTLQDAIALPFDVLPGIEESAQGQMTDLVRDVTGAVAEQTAAFDADTQARWRGVDAAHASMGAAIAHHSALSQGTGVVSAHDSMIRQAVQSQQDLARETQTATRSLQDQLNAQRAAVDPVFAVADAQRSLADAQARVTELQAAGDTPAAEIAAAQQAVALAAIEAQGAMIDLNEAQASGATSSADLRDNLQLLVDQGLITQGTLDALTGQFGGLAGAARDAATAMLDASIQAGDFGYTDSIVRQAVRGSGGGVIEDFTGSGTAADYSTATPVVVDGGSSTSRSIVWNGDINVTVGSGAGGSVDALGREFHDRVMEAFVDALGDESSR